MCIRDRGGPEVPLRVKGAAAGANFDAEGNSESREEIVMAITTLETHLLPEQRELLTHLTKDFLITESKAYELLMKYPVERVDLQVRAFEWRELDAKNKAGFLINAIEQDYALPEKFQDRLRKIQFEKDRAKREAEAEIWRKEEDLKIAACTFCDEGGHRDVKHPEDPKYKAFHMCSHDADIESKFEDWQEPKLDR